MRSLLQYCREWMQRILYLILMSKKFPVMVLIQGQIQTIAKTRHRSISLIPIKVFYLQSNSIKTLLYILSIQRKYIPWKPILYITGGPKSNTVFWSPRIKRPWRPMDSYPNFRFLDELTSGFRFYNNAPYKRPYSMLPMFRFRIDAPHKRSNKR